MVSSAKQAKRKRLAQEAQRRESFRPTHQMDLSDPGTEEDDQEIKFVPQKQNVEEISSTPARAQVITDCDILNMVRTLNGAIAAVSQDTARIQKAYDQLRTENIARDRALTDLSEIVKEYGSSPVRMRPQPVSQTDVMDEDGNLRATDIGITWENNETFLHGVRVVGLGSPRPTGVGPAMSTPYQPMGRRGRDNTSTTRYRYPHTPTNARDSPGISSGGTYPTV